MRCLQKAQPELGITDRDVRNVAIAGLCHDLGHGPFSHMFDNLFIRSIEKKTGVVKDFWSHEDASIMMFEDILNSDETLKQLITKEDQALICSLILGEVIPGRAWISEIVSNPRNGIDVDKFDYLRRDTQKTNMNYCSFNHEKIMKQARVIED